MSTRSILFATSEAHPLMKTGGLGDVSGSLPKILKTLRQDIRIIMPAYQSTLQKINQTKTIATITVEGFASYPVKILETRLPGSSVKVYLVDVPHFFDRPGNPYCMADGKDWPDNGERFTVFCRTVVEVATNRIGLNWSPDIVHCNDWQSGLVPALLSKETKSPATVFTIHNLAYQGLFTRDEYSQFHLPTDLWSIDAMEFYGKFSFIKGGITFADMLNTVSPQYAKEICTKEYGCGLEVLLRKRADHLVGILNGVDYQQWNPAKDANLAHAYNTHTWKKKAQNKRALQKRFTLPVDSSIPLIGMVGRMVVQKGFDLVLNCMPEIMEKPVQLVILGSGDKKLETSLDKMTEQYPKKLAAHIGYNEELAHQIEGGADMFLMPSRYEPCGLNQIYSLRYGTIPIVRYTGGLANTVVDAKGEAIARETATGFVFTDSTSDSLMSSITRALDCYQNKPKIWKKLAYRGMQQDFSWRQSAKHYLSLYQRALNNRNSEKNYEKKIPA